jgi:GNAT superfamily N-acetyltransferase
MPLGPRIILLAWVYARRLPKDETEEELMPAQPVIRNAIESDIPLVLSFIKELAEYEKLSEQVTATEELLRENLLGADRKAEAVIAEYHDDPAGFALFFHNFSTFLGKPGLYLEDLYVSPDMRGRGIGAALLRYLAGLAVERGCGRFEWSVLDWNEPAINFYRNMGAVPVDGWTVYRLTGQPLLDLAGSGTGRLPL